MGKVNTRLRDAGPRREGSLRMGYRAASAFLEETRCCAGRRCCWAIKSSWGAPASGTRMGGVDEKHHAVTTKSFERSAPFPSRASLSSWSSSASLSLSVVVDLWDRTDSKQAQTKDMAESRSQVTFRTSITGCGSHNRSPSRPRFGRTEHAEDVSRSAAAKGIPQLGAGGSSSSSSYFLHLSSYIASQYTLHDL